MKIMTFNTQHCCNFLENKIDFQIMTDAIKQCDPDIVGLNEMRGLGIDPDYTDQVKKLSELTGMQYYYFAKAIDTSGGPYGNGILSKTPIKSTEVIMIPDPDRKADGYGYETRCILKAEFDNDLMVLVTHFGLNSDEQENAVKTVVSTLRDKKCVLMGDFNVTPDNGILLPVSQRMKDTAQGFCENKFSFPSDNPNIKIDYIFVSEDMEVLNADIPVIIASDHRPHTATVRERKKRKCNINPL